MGWFLKVFRRSGYRVALDEASATFLYREPGRCLRVSGEIMADGYAVYAGSIGEWEAAAGEAGGDIPVMDEAERLRIAGNIRRYFVKRGKAVYLS
jgi:hypothetical protein